jgi:hypothetical protein
MEEYLTGKGDTTAAKRAHAEKDSPDDLSLIAEL